MRYPGIAAVLLLPLLLNTALAADPDDVDSQWEPPQAAGGNSESDYANPDRRRMDEERRKDVLDQLCRHLKLRTTFKFGGASNTPFANLGVTRRMQADFDNSLILIDDERLELGWSLGQGHTIAGDATSGALSISANLSGRSIVARRLGTYGTCDEVDRLLNLTDVKVIVPIMPEHMGGVETVLVPISAESIAAMGKEELWRLPLTVNLGYGASAGTAPAEDVSISMGWSNGKSGASSMTLWRLSEKQARFRFRVDFVQVVSKSAGVNVTLPPIEFATEGGNILSRFLRRQIANRLHRYTNAYMNVGSAKSDGRRLILEYLIDPTDAKQAEALAEALKGNFLTLTKFGLRVQTGSTTSEDTLAAYDNLQGLNAEHLGEPNYAARSDYSGQSKSFNYGFPFIVSGSRSYNYAKDSVTRFSGDGGVFEFNSASFNPQAEYFHVPFIGPMVKDIESRNVDVITHAEDGVTHANPIAVYVHNQGFLRFPTSAVAGIAEDANSVLRLTGVARNRAADPTMQLPVGRFMPAPEPVFDPNGVLPPTEVGDQKGWTSFTLVMNQKAVQEALSVTHTQVLQAFARAVPLADRTWAEWLVANGRLEGGRLVYDESQAKADLGIDNERGGSGWLAKLAKEGAGLAMDLADASVATLTPEARSAALAKSLSHKNRSGLPPQDVVKVLVQFMDPLDVTGDFVSAVDGTSKRATKIQAHYQLKKGRADVPMLKHAGETRGRFSDGPEYTD